MRSLLIKKKKKKKNYHQAQLFKALLVFAPDNNPIVTGNFKFPIDLLI